MVSRGTQLIFPSSSDKEKKFCKIATWTQERLQSWPWSLWQHASPSSGNIFAPESCPLSENAS